MTGGAVTGRPTVFHGWRKPPSEGFQSALSRVSAVRPAIEKARMTRKKRVSAIAMR